MLRPPSRSVRLTLPRTQVAAGLDESAFPLPREIDPTRPEKSYVQYGWGPHSCIGAEIAVTALAVMLKVFGKLDGLRIVPPGIKSVPLRGRVFLSEKWDALSPFPTCGFLSLPAHTPWRWGWWADSAVFDSDEIAVGCAGRELSWSCMVAMAAQRKMEGWIRFSFLLGPGLDTAVGTAPLELRTIHWDVLRVDVMSNSERAWLLRSEFSFSSVGGRSAVL